MSVFPTIAELILLDEESLLSFLINPNNGEVNVDAAFILHTRMVEEEDKNLNDLKNRPLKRKRDREPFSMDLNWKHSTW
jgi:hypothetical protein